MSDWAERKAAYLRDADTLARVGYGNSISKSVRELVAEVERAEVALDAAANTLGQLHRQRDEARRAAEEMRHRILNHWSYHPDYQYPWESEERGAGPQHHCGLQGFDPTKGDVCSACSVERGEEPNHSPAPSSGPFAPEFRGKNGPPDVVQAWRALRSDWRNPVLARAGDALCAEVERLRERGCGRWHYEDRESVLAELARVNALVKAWREEDINRVEKVPPCDLGSSCTGDPATCPGCALAAYADTLEDSK